MIDSLTKLEDHPDGGNVNAIVQSNWLTLKKWVDPDLADSDPLFTVLIRALLKLDEAELAALANGLFLTWDATNKRVLATATPAGAFNSLTVGALTISGKAILPTYTAAQLTDGVTLPVEANARAVVYCSDGDGGNPCLAVSNGTNWKVIAFGANL